MRNTLNYSDFAGNEAGQFIQWITGVSINKLLLALILINYPNQTIPKKIRH